MEGRARRPYPAVLLADDDARFRTLVRSMLESDGYHVVAEASDARETLQMVVHHQPDVIVVDLVMDGSRGLSTVQALLALDRHRPVIVISSLFDPVLEIETTKLGAWYLEKVEGVEALEHAIDQAVSVTRR